MIEIGIRRREEVPPPPQQDPPAIPGADSSAGPLGGPGRGGGPGGLPRPPEPEFQDVVVGAVSREAFLEEALVAVGLNPLEWWRATWPAGASQHAQVKLIFHEEELIRAQPFGGAVQLQWGDILMDRMYALAPQPLLIGPGGPYYGVEFVDERYFWRDVAAHQGFQFLEEVTSGDPEDPAPGTRAPLHLRRQYREGQSGFPTGPGTWQAFNLRNVVENRLYRSTGFVAHLGRQDPTQPPGQQDDPDFGAAAPVSVGGMLAELFSALLGWPAKGFDWTTQPQAIPLGLRPVLSGPFTDSRVRDMTLFATPTTHAIDQLLAYMGATLYAFPSDDLFPEGRYAIVANELGARRLADAAIQYNGPGTGVVGGGPRGGATQKSEPEDPGGPTEPIDLTGMDDAGFRAFGTPAEWANNEIPGYVRVAFPIDVFKGPRSFDVRDAANTLYGPQLNPLMDRYASARFWYSDRIATEPWTGVPGNLDREVLIFGEARARVEVHTGDPDDEDADGGELITWLVDDPQNPGEVIGADPEDGERGLLNSLAITQVRRYLSRYALPLGRTTFQGYWPIFAGHLTEWTWPTENVPPMTLVSADASSRLLRDVYDQPLTVRNLHTSGATRIIPKPGGGAVIASPEIQASRLQPAEVVQYDDGAAPDGINARYQVRLLDGSERLIPPDDDPSGNGLGWNDSSENGLVPEERIHYFGEDAQDSVDEAVKWVPAAIGTPCLVFEPGPADPYTNGPGEDGARFYVLRLVEEVELVACPDDPPPLTQSTRQQIDSRNVIEDLQP